MNPIKVKVYGLLNLTKKQYLTIQTIGFSIAGILFILSFFFNLDRIFLGNAKALLLILIIFEVIETFFILRKFSKKEEAVTK